MQEHSFPLAIFMDSIDRLRAKLLVDAQILDVSDALVSKRLTLRLGDIIGGRLCDGFLVSMYVATIQATWRRQYEAEHCRILKSTHTPFFIVGYAGLRTSVLEFGGRPIPIDGCEETSLLRN
jgi:hypothetical protein